MNTLADATTALIKATHDVIACARRNHLGHDIDEVHNPCIAAFVHARYEAWNAIERARHDEARYRELLHRIAQGFGDPDEPVVEVPA